MKCQFCKQELSVFREDWSTEWDCLDNRIYDCKSCHATFTQKVVYEQKFTNVQKNDWEWVDSGKEELNYYHMSLENYEIECFVWSNGPLIIKKWDEDHKWIWPILRLPTITANIHPHNLIPRIKTWLLFS
jgi:hypothetical protein